MLSFCKKRGSGMSADEKSLCVKGLKEMQEKTPDEYIQGIFSLAVNALGGK